LPRNLNLKTGAGDGNRTHIISLEGYTRGFLPGARLSALRLQIFLFTQTKLALSQYQPEFKDAYCARGEKEELIFTSSSHSY